MQGLLGSDGGYDVGIEIGASGIGRDDVRSFSFTLASSLRALTLDDFANVDFGLRITSVGQDTNGDGIIDTSRSLSSKLGETTFDPITARDDELGVLEDSIANGIADGNVFDNDTGPGAKVLLSVSYDGTDYYFSGSDPIVISADGGVAITIKANGEYEVDASGADWLAKDQSADYTIFYVAQQTVEGDAPTDEGVLTLTITGTNDAPVIGAVVDSGAVTERADGAADENTGDLTAAGTIAFTDVDLTNTHAVSAMLMSATDSHAGAISELGTFVPTLSEAATGDGSGTVSWGFTVAAGALDYLAAGRTVTQIYRVTVTDSSGATATQNVMIVLHGTDDRPLITAEPGDTAGVNHTETNDPLVISGTLTVSDIDVSDVVVVHFVEATTEGNTSGLTEDPASFFTFAPADTAAVDTAMTTTGQINWTFDSGAQTFDYLAAGEVVKLHYKLRPIDNGREFPSNGDGVVAITVTGTNDAPAITGEVFEGGVTEIADLAAGENATMHTATGTIAFADFDLSDTHSASVNARGGDYLGTLNLGAVDQAGNSVGGTFEVADSALDSLAAGEVLTQLYDVQVSDGHGGTAIQTVTVTITGANDAPTILGGDGKVTTPIGTSDDIGRGVALQPDGKRSWWPARAGPGRTWISLWSATIRMGAWTLLSEALAR
jgi:VCBS repeat-containing protein